ncbi:MAG: DUF4147 domain-containing protein, partial [Rhizobiaceae bacterium]|nr:DUF4147 domain-containing protein [Rhizobiaceae bacterium]
MAADDRRDALEAIFSAVVAAAHPATMLATHLPEPPKGRVMLLAAGKAGASMAAAAADHYARH